MVLGYAYERVREDRTRRYGPLDDKTAWWEWYFQDEGRAVEYLPLSQLHVVQGKDSDFLGVLVANNAMLEAAHIVVVDELGVIDPADGFPDHLTTAQWETLRAAQGFVLDSEFLVIHPVVRGSRDIL